MYVVKYLSTSYVCSAISKHANFYNVICSEQHGFRKHRSCETQLLETINDLAMSLNRGVQTDNLLLNFSKAFNKVSHPRLLYKLKHHGIKGPLFHWIEDYLLDTETSESYLGRCLKQFLTSIFRSTSGICFGAVAFLTFYKRFTSRNNLLSSCMPMMSFLQTYSFYSRRVTTSGVNILPLWCMNKAHSV